MENFSVKELKKLYVPPAFSHKGQNGKLMIIGGSVLFHTASLWALEVASRIVDMVFYSSVVQNNEIVARQKEAFRNGIIIQRDKIENYIEEADCVLIGPGLPREKGEEKGDDDTKELSQRLLVKYPDKKWVVDGGSLQVISPEILPKTAIITPHMGEFEKLFNFKSNTSGKIPQLQNKVYEMAGKYNCTILLKGQEDIIADKDKSVTIKGGNAGMTKGGTGDVLAGLTASLYCKNDAFLSAACASYINKKAAEGLYKKMGIYY